MQNMTLEWKEGGHGLIKNYSHADYNNYSIDTELFPYNNGNTVLNINNLSNINNYNNESILPNN